MLGGRAAMKYRLTWDISKRILFTVHMRAVAAGESWVRKNPTNNFWVQHVKKDDEDFNVVCVCDAHGHIIGWLTDEDVL